MAWLKKFLRKWRNRTVSVWVDVRYEGIIGAVACFKKEGHAYYQTEHDALFVRVHYADDNQQDPRDDAKKMDPRLLPPCIRTIVDYVRDHSAQRSKGNVEKPKHGGPSSRSGLSKAGEIFEIIGTKDGIDGQLGPKGTKVAAE